MEAFALIAGFLYIAVVGYLAMDRLGHFLDKGGISPYWDETEERQAQDAKRSPCIRTLSASKRVAIPRTPR